MTARTIAASWPEIPREEAVDALAINFMETTMHSTRNTLDQTIRTQAVELLNKHLATAIDLHAQVKQAHWNVRGPT